jgi:hypothetical protein
MHLAVTMDEMSIYARPLTAREVRGLCLLGSPKPLLPEDATRSSGKPGPADTEPRIEQEKGE